MTADTKTAEEITAIIVETTEEIIVKETMAGIIGMESLKETMEMEGMEETMAVNMSVERHDRRGGE